MAALTKFYSNEIDEIFLKLINPDTSEGMQLLPNLAAKIKFKELIKIFET